MGRSVNKVTLIGLLGQEPEVRYMPNGNAVVNLTLATDESYMDKQTGQKVEATEWHRIVAYGKLAEIIGKYLKKGSKAYFEGKLKTREWEKDGVKRYTTEIVANDMMMLDGKQMSEQSANRQQHSYQQQGGYGAGPAYQAQGTAPQQQRPQADGYQQPAARPAQQAGPSAQFDNDDSIPF